MKIRILVLLLLMTGFASTGFSRSQRIMVVSADSVLNVLSRLPDSGTVVINFWATWCGPCVEEIPYFSKADSMLQGENVTFIFISLDAVKRKNAVEKFVSSKNMVGSHLLVKVFDLNDFINRVDRAWQGSIPYTVVLTKDGRKNREGSFSSFQDLWGFIRN